MLSPTVNQTKQQELLKTPGAMFAVNMATFVPDTVKRLLLKHSTKREDPPSAPLSYEMTAVTMFADISGFTALSEGLAGKGEIGAELLGKYLNVYLERLVKVVVNAGGDIFKFAGDAMIILWPPYETDTQRVERQMKERRQINAGVQKTGPHTAASGKRVCEAKLVNHGDVTDEQLEETVRRACQCAVAIQDEMDRAMKEEDVELRIKLGIGCGRVTVLHVGGVYNRLECLAVGQPLIDAFASEHHAVAGDSIIAKSAFQFLKRPDEEFQFEEVEADPEFHYIRDDYGREPIVEEPADGERSEKTVEDSDSVLQVSDELQQKRDLENAQCVLKDIPLRDLTGKMMQSSLKSYIPAAVVPHLRINTKTWAAELRQVSIMFVSIGLKLSADEAVDERMLSRIQTVIAQIQTAIYSYEGSLNKFLLDDKGSTLIAVFGLPPVAHENDPMRACLCALKLKDDLQKLGLGCNIGVTSGQAYCGLTGGSIRREYTVLGDRVNLSARLMQHSGKTDGRIYCDKNTFDAAETQPRLNFTAHEAIMVKGKTIPVEIWSISFDKYAVQGTPDPCRFSVGRKGALDRLHESVVRCVATGEGECVLVIGELGTGKTHLLRQLSYSMAEHAVFAWGRADVLNQNNKSQCHATLRSLIRNVLIGNEFLCTNGFGPSFEDSLYRYVWQNRPDLVPYLGSINEILGVNYEKTWALCQLKTQQMMEMAADICVLLIAGSMTDQTKKKDKLNDLSSSDEEDIETDEESSFTRSSQMEDSASDASSSEIAEVPTILVVDSAQWMSAEDWGVLKYIAESINNGTVPKVSLIISTRPLDHAKYKPLFSKCPQSYFDIIKTQCASHITVGRWNMHQTKLFLESELKVKKVAPRFVAVVHERSGGIPLSVKKFTQLLLGDQFLDLWANPVSLKMKRIRELNYNHACEPGAVVPFQVKRSAATHIDRLGPRCKIILKLAATICTGEGNGCIGFRLSQIIGCHNIAQYKEHIERDLDKLCSLGYISSGDVVFEQDASDDDGAERYYYWDQGFMRDCVYQVMLFSQRRMMHECVIDYLVRCLELLKYDTPEADLMEAARVIARNKLLKCLCEDPSEYAEKFAQAQKEYEEVIDDVLERKEFELADCLFEDNVYSKENQIALDEVEEGEGGGAVRRTGGGWCGSGPDEDVPAQDDEKSGGGELERTSGTEKLDILADMLVDIEELSTTDIDTVEVTVKARRKTMANVEAMAIMRMSRMSGGTMSMRMSRNSGMRGSQLRASKGSIASRLSSGSRRSSAFGRSSGRMSRSSRSSFGARDSLKGTSNGSRDSMGARSSEITLKGGDQGTGLGKIKEDDVASGRASQAPGKMRASALNVGASMHGNAEEDEDLPPVMQIQKDLNEISIPNCVDRSPPEPREGAGVEPIKKVIFLSETLNEMPARSREKALSELPSGQDRVLVDILRGDSIRSWRFDIFEFGEATYGQPLLYMAYKVFERYDLLTKFEIDERKFVSLLMAVEHAYNLQNNAYHSSLHAADVLQSTVSMLEKSRFIRKLEDWQLLSIFLACIFHDYAHPGVNNSFLLLTEHPICNYWENSYLENFHNESAFILMEQAEFELLENLGDEAMYARIFDLIREIILATDLATHFEFMQNCKNLRFWKEFQQGRVSDYPMDDHERSMLIKLFVKCADISNAAKPFNMFEQWVDRSMSEFHAQGDAEHKRGLPISRYMDRNQPERASCMKNYIKHIVRPLNRILVAKFPRMDDIVMPHIDGNYEIYLERERKNPPRAPKAFRDRIVTWVPGFDDGQPKSAPGILRTAENDQGAIEIQEEEEGPVWYKDGKLSEETQKKKAQLLDAHKVTQEDEDKAMTKQALDMVKPSADAQRGSGSSESPETEQAEMD